MMSSRAAEESKQPSTVPDRAAKRGGESHTTAVVLTSTGEIEEPAIMGNIGGIEERETSSTMRNARPRQAQVGAHIVDISSEGNIQPLLVMPEQDILMATSSEPADATLEKSAMLSSVNNEYNHDFAAVPQAAVTPQATVTAPTALPSYAPPEVVATSPSMPQITIASSSSGSASDAWSKAMMIGILLIVLAMFMCLLGMLNQLQQRFKTASLNPGRKPIRHSGRKTTGNSLAPGDIAHANSTMSHAGTMSHAQTNNFSDNDADQSFNPQDFMSRDSDDKPRPQNAEATSPLARAIDNLLDHGLASASGFGFGNEDNTQAFGNEDNTQASVSSQRRGSRKVKETQFSPEMLDHGFTYETSLDNVRTLSSENVDL
jgi:hypothetical protein